MSECEDVRPRLTAFLDGEVEDSDVIEAHLNSCPECARMLDIHKKVTRLASLVPGLSPHSAAWTELEARLSRFSGGRLLALGPAAAVAAIAIVLYIFLFSHAAAGRQPVGSLTRKVGLVRIKPFVGQEWIQPEEKHELYEGDSVNTGPDGAARLDLADGGHVMLDANTEVCIVRKDAPVLRVMLVSGRTCACGDCLCVEAVDVEIDIGGSHCVVAIENGSPVVYVKSGRLNWMRRRGRKAGCVETMHMFDLTNGYSPVPITDPKVFDWVDKLPH